MYILLATKPNIMISNGKCSKCNKQNLRNKQSYCHECHAEYMRLNRRVYSQLNDDEKQKGNTRSYANAYQRRGYIKKQSCLLCNNHNSEKHHPDYDDPLNVIWLCRRCHNRLHKAKRSTIHTYINKS